MNIAETLSALRLEQEKRFDALQRDVDRNYSMVSGYHKEKNRCLETCNRNTSKLEDLKTETAVQDNRIGTVEDAVSEISDSVKTMDKTFSKSLNGLYLRVGIIVGVLLTISKAIDLLPW